MSHALQRPSWLCECGDPWPCPVRRWQLLDEYSNSLYELRLVMAGFLDEAFADSVGLVEVRRAQLVGWLPRHGGGARHG